ncbi:MAG TPA: D-inositol-3-phosphate glycosyltransferase [Dermatophilaceae bacterium]|nr:D-inositol-3-phosphate glycosyltransferase [Dermatophilaceae bacterium]
MTPEQIRRIAMISVHTSPLEQPGTGDAGGLNVYVSEVARELARTGREVEILTRATTGALPPTVELTPGVTVRHITAGPYEGLSKHDLPGQLCAFAAGVMRIGAARPEGWFDLVHSHYWLSGQVGWLAADRWQVPLVHTMHTMARVKNAALAAGDSPEPPGREIGEAQVVEAADMLTANTVDEAEQLTRLYAADPARVRVVPPGVDLSVFTPGDRLAARALVGLPTDARVLLFVGRIQPLKAPDLLVRAARALLDRHPEWRHGPGQLVVAIVGGPSGSGLEHPESLAELTAELGLQTQVRFVKPVARELLAQWYRAADLVAVPSYNESFGLVAVEALACGTPVVAARVGGLPTAVGAAGVLVASHELADWADALEGVLLDDDRRARLSRKAVAHAADFGWEATAQRLLQVYADAGRTRTPSPIADAGALVGVPALVIP